MVTERRRSAEAPARAARAAAGRRAGDGQPDGDGAVSPVTIRFATPADAASLARLAQLDSRRPPQLPALVAEVDGQFVAALSISGGEAVADPFRRTADIVGLLELRASQLDESWVQRRRLLRRVPGLRERRRRASPAPG